MFCCPTCPDAHVCACLPLCPARLQRCIAEVSLSFCSRLGLFPKWTLMAWAQHQPITQPCLMISRSPIPGRLLPSRRRRTSLQVAVLAHIHKC